MWCRNLSVFLIATAILVYCSHGTSAGMNVPAGAPDSPAEPRRLTDSTGFIGCKHDNKKSAGLVVHTVIVSNEFECYELAVVTVGINSYSYNRRRKICWLERVSGFLVDDTDWVSGSLQCSTESCIEFNIRYEGDEVGSHTDVKNVIECHNTCRLPANTRCVHSSYESVTKTCILSGASAIRTPVPKWVSGKRNCDPAVITATKCFQPNILFAGTEDDRINTVVVANADHCLAYCLIHRTCTHVSYDTVEDQCTLRSRITGEEGHDDYVSGKINCSINFSTVNTRCIKVNFDLAGTNQGAAHPAILNMYKCQEKCRKNQANGWVYTSGNQECQCKTGVSDFTPTTAGTASGKIKCT